MNKMKALIPALAAAAIGWSGIAYAGSQSGNLTVKIEIVEGCVINSAALGSGNLSGDIALDFGKVLDLKKDIEQSTTTSGASLQIQCTAGTDYTVGLGDGQNKDATSRRMKGGKTGTDYVPYQLYKDAARTQPWGNNKGTDALTAKPTVAGSPDKIEIFGRVPKLATTPSAGVYTDIVPITISF